MEQKELNDKLTEYKNIGSIKEIKEVFIKSVECINNNKLLMNDIKKLSDSNSLLYIEVERLKTELAELKQNAIVPKFKINHIVWYIGNDKVQKGTIEEIRYYKTTGISYYLPNLQRETFWIYECDLYETKSEAEEALKKLEK